jgi:hypothetical protein
VRFFLDERFRTLALQRKYASLPHYRSFTLDELTAGTTDPDLHILVGLIRIQEGKKLSTKIEKMKKFHVLRCWMMFSFES